MKIKLSVQLKHHLTKELFCHQALVREFFSVILLLNWFLKMSYLLYFLIDLLGWYRAVLLVLNMILSKLQIANTAAGKGRLYPVIAKILSCKECVEETVMLLEETIFKYYCL